jgi:hypothetical protein
LLIHPAEGRGGGGGELGNEGGVPVGPASFVGAFLAG